MPVVHKVRGIHLVPFAEILNVYRDPRLVRLIRRHVDLHLGVGVNPDVTHGPLLRKPGIGPPSQIAYPNRCRRFISPMWFPSLQKTPARPPPILSHGNTSEASAACKDRLRESTESLSDPRSFTHALSSAVPISHECELLTPRHRRLQKRAQRTSMFFRGKTHCRLRVKKTCRCVCARWHEFCSIYSNICRLARDWWDTAMRAKIPLRQQVKMN